MSAWKPFAREAAPAAAAAAVQGTDSERRAKRATGRWGLGLVLALAACRSHPPEALDPAAIVGEVARRRERPDEGAPGATLEYARVRGWALAQAPRLRAAVAAYETELALAGVPTPWPNPSLDGGVDFASGPDVVANDVAPVVGLALRIPLGGRLGAADDRTLARAVSARWRALEAWAGVDAELRLRWHAAVAAQQARELAAELASGARAALAAGERLVAAGELGALDLGLLEVAAARAEADELAAGARYEAELAALAQLAGVATAALAGTLEPLPAPPVAPPELAAARARMIAAHPGLARLRAEYDAAERRLALELAEQVPDLTFGGSYGDEAGDRKSVLGLRLGLELPLFDRNQQGIEQALAARREARVRYEAAANEALAELERASAAWQAAARQLALLRERVLPPARAQAERARQGLATGAFGVLRLLEALRALGEIRRDELAAEAAVAAAAVAHERAIGLAPGDAPAPAARPAAERLQEQELRR
jgi:cobalt-zinc-cadmium efflux system outer membrane protein